VETDHLLEKFGEAPTAEERAEGGKGGMQVN
jgi:hypothetical protein